ncbi:MAG: TfoX/Sxy family protein [Tenuifilaceae bacterium]
MAYSEMLANRVRERLMNLQNIEEKEMMGGLVFMFNGKMCVGIIKDELMCRIDPEIHNLVVEKLGCRTMDFTKKPMKGYLMIEDIAMRTQRDLDYWIHLALDYNKFAKATKKKK